MKLKQGLETLIAAARLAPAPVRVVRMGDSSQPSALEGLGAAVQLSSLPPADSADFRDVLGAADVLVANERASAVDMSLPSKLTLYLSAVRPVVAAVPAGGGTAEEADRSGDAVLVPPKALAAIEESRWAPELRQRLGAPERVHAREELSVAASLGRLTEVLLRAARALRAAPAADMTTAARPSPRARGTRRTCSGCRPPG